MASVMCMRDKDMSGSNQKDRHVSESSELSRKGRETVCTTDVAVGSGHCALAGFVPLLLASKVEDGCACSTLFGPWAAYLLHLPSYLAKGATQIRVSR